MQHLSLIHFDLEELNNLRSEIQRVNPLGYMVFLNFNRLFSQTVKQLVTKIFEFFELEITKPCMLRHISEIALSGLNIGVLYAGSTRKSPI